MQQRLPSLYQQTILFAHRGASAHAPENTIDAFRLALKLGATGLETDCWVTKDRHVVLDHDGVVRQKRFARVRSKKIRECDFSDIQLKMPKLSDLLEISASDTPISIDLCDPTAMPIIDHLVASPESRNRIFICHPDLELLASLKQQYPFFRYVNSIRLRKISEGPERRCANLAEFEIDVLNMHHTDWNGGLVALAHRFNIGAFSWDLQHTEQICSALLMGVDAVYSDWPDRMVDAQMTILKS